jgi:cysteine-rich repeat protein
MEESMAGQVTRSFLAAVLVTGAGCSPPTDPRVTWLAPGASVTHAVVSVHAFPGQPESWRLRTTATLGLRSGTSLLPEEAPREPLEYPVSFVVKAPGGEGTLFVRVEVLAQDGAVVGRARGSAVLVPNGSVFMELRLGQPCTGDLECADGVFCNGVERCVLDVCAAPDRVACPESPFACVLQGCVEEARTCSVRVNHDLCPPLVNPDGTTDTTYCDPVSGCVRGQPCDGDGDCADPYVCNGAERCVAGRCMGGAPPSADDSNPCTLDSCAEPAGAMHTPVPHGNRCTTPTVPAGVCVTGTCVETTCGDGVVDVLRDEECDDGWGNSDVEPDACRTNCQPARCGDGVPDSTESCDGAPDCRADCTRCGDGVKQEVEACDNGAANSNQPDAVCRVDCTPGRCGDNVQDSGEACDDGNTVDGDGCAGTCLRREVCGDGVKDPQEACDDGNLNPADGCDGCAQFRWDAQPLVGGSLLATTYGLKSPYSLAVDRRGNLYVCDAGHNTVLRVDGLTGTVTAVAGRGSFGFSGDGQVATSAHLHEPMGIALDGLGNLYVADHRNNRVRRVDGSTGVITTVAGTGTGGYAGDGSAATNAQLRRPSGVAVDGLGNLYVADTDNHVIRRVDATTGVITTVAGTGAPGSDGDGGPAVEGGLRVPLGLALHGLDLLFIADSGNHKVRRVDLPAGTITTVAGTGVGGHSGDGGPATAATLNEPTSVALDTLGRLLVAVFQRQRIRRVDLGTGTITTVAGSGELGFSGDGGPATEAAIMYPRGVAAGPDGSFYLTDHWFRRVRRVDGSTGIITTVAGSGVFGNSGDGTLATSVQLTNAPSVSVDRAGRVLVIDSSDRVRAVDPLLGTTSTVAGVGTRGYSGDGALAVAAEFKSPGATAVDGDGNLFIADTMNYRVRRVDAASGVVTTVAGTGSPWYAGDGSPAVEARVGMVEGLATDAQGNLFLAESQNHVVRRVDVVTGTITTVAGTANAGYGGDGDLATGALLRAPRGLALDGPGNLYVADSENNRVRRIDGVTGTITTVAGTGVGAYAGDGGLATGADLQYPTGVAVDAWGNLYVADTGNHRIRRVDVETGVITTVVGDGEMENSGDGGLAIHASLLYPRAVAFDLRGHLLVGDTSNSRVRRVDAVTGRIVTVAGLVDPVGMGPVAHARLADPVGVALAGDVLLVAGGASGTVQVLRQDAQWLEVVAGRYQHVNATANLARFRDWTFGVVGGVAHDRERGLIYLTESTANRVHVVRMVDPADKGSWTMEPLVNAQGTPGFADGPAVTARLRNPTALLLEGRTLHVADTGNHVIRAVDLDAMTVSTTFGTPETMGFHGDRGPADQALLNQPRAMTRCGDGAFFMADTGNNRVRRVDASGTVDTVLGDGVAASSGDGAPSRTFPVDQPLGLGCDSFGNLYVTSRTAVRVVAADDEGLVDGSGWVRSIYGAPPRDSFPAVATTCLTGLAVTPEDGVLVTDSCSGMLVELTRRAVVP